MYPPDPPFVCPHCGGPSPRQTPRYFDAVCDPCVERMTDADGRAVRAYNATLLGTGLLVLHRDDESECASATATGDVLIDGRPYVAWEGRFGGVVVQPPRA